MKKTLSFIIFAISFFYLNTHLVAESTLAEKKKTICLNMIVKNESDVITRCLESVLPIIDSWIIVDTGSTDGTQKIIKEYLKNIPGKLYERPWVNFAHNRQEALILAKDQADYILYMDADDKLVFSKDFKMPNLTYGFYAIPSHNPNDEIFLIHRLIKSDLNWFWEGVLHEELLCKDSVDGVILEGVEYVYIHDGARAKDPETWKKDAQILSEAIKNDPNNTRNYFYMAMSYRAGGDLVNALEAFQSRASMNAGSQEEIYLSKLYAAQIQGLLKEDPKIIKKGYIDAFLTRPKRLEALYYLIIYLRHLGECEKAYQLAVLANELLEKSSDCLAVETNIYAYGLTFQLAVSAACSGHYFEGANACKKLLELKLLSKDDLIQIENLYNELQQKKAEQINKNLNQLFQQI